MRVSYLRGPMTASIRLVKPAVSPFLSSILASSSPTGCGLFSTPMTMSITTCHLQSMGVIAALHCCLYRPPHSSYLGLAPEPVPGTTFTCGWKIGLSNSSVGPTKGYFSGNSIPRFRLYPRYSPFVGGKGTTQYLIFSSFRVSSGKVCRVAFRSPINRLACILLSTETWEGGTG